MMLTHRLSALAHDLAKQCHVANTSKPEEKVRGKKPAEETIQSSMDKSHRKLYDAYEIGSVIGSGGFGKVYAGTCKKTGNTVAIKVVPRKQVFGWTELGDNLVSKEVALLHSLKHKFVIKLLDYFETQDKFYVVMERPEKYIDLFDYITQKGTVSERSARYLFRQVVEAVQYCLSQGVLHGDIKDENILIDLKSNQVKLIDFGSSSFLKDGVYKEYGGTKVYSPPEWILNKYYHAVPATVWSLGILLYNMLQGDVPFQYKSDIVMAHLSFPVNISQDAEALIRWMLSFDPDDRPSIEQVLNHPWIKTPSSTSSSASSSAHYRPRPSSSGSTSSYMSTPSPSPSSSSSTPSYHRPPVRHSPPAPTPPTPSLPPPRWSGRRVGGGGSESFHTSSQRTMQTRSQTRMQQQLVQGPAASVGGRSSHYVYGYGQSSSSSSSSSSMWISGSPRTPVQVRRGQSSQVARKK